MAIQVSLHRRPPDKDLSTLYPEFNSNFEALYAQPFLNKMLNDSIEYCYLENKNKAVNDEIYMPDDLDRFFIKRGKYDGTIICINFDLVINRNVEDQYVLVISSYGKKIIKDKDIRKFIKGNDIPTMFEYIDMFIDRLKIIMVIEKLHQKN